jgi:hypothetical protein
MARRLTLLAQPEMVLNALCEVSAQLATTFRAEAAPVTTRNAILCFLSGTTLPEAMFPLQNRSRFESERCTLQIPRANPVAHQR